MYMPERAYASPCTRTHRSTAAPGRAERAVHPVHGGMGRTVLNCPEQLIVGTRHVRVQEKLLEQGDSLASFNAALDIARTFEATKSHVAELLATEPVHVYAMVSTLPTAQARNRCDQCGRSHAAKKESCPAHGQKCHNCGKLGHFSRLCRSSSAASKPGQTAGKGKSNHRRSDKRKAVNTVELQMTSH